MLFIGYRWLDDRIAIRDVFDDVGSKYVPPHVNISIGFGTLPCVWPSLASLGRYTDRLMHVPEVSRSLSSSYKLVFQSSKRNISTCWVLPYPGLGLGYRQGCIHALLPGMDSSEGILTPVSEWCSTFLSASSIPTESSVQVESYGVGISGPLWRTH